MAPIITFTACSSCIIPEFTKPTTITMVAVEDWITAVTPAPTKTALTGLLVSFSSIFSSLLPETLDRPSPIMCIPYRNRASPPIIVRRSKKSICVPNFLFSVQFLLTISIVTKKRPICNNLFRKFFVMFSVSVFPAPRLQGLTTRPFFLKDRCSAPAPAAPYPE